MKRDEMLAGEIDGNFKNENYFDAIVPPWLGQEDEAVFTAETVPEMPAVILVMDSDICLADDETCWWDEYDCVDENGWVEDTEDAIDPVEGEDCVPDDEEIDDDYDGYGCCKEDEMDEYEELGLIVAEFFGDADCWDRSNDDGWYYE